MKRSNFYPKAETVTKKTEIPEFGIEVFYYVTPQGQPAAKVFSGRRAKPDFNYRFQDESRRDAFVNRYIETETQIRNRQAQDKAARKATQKSAVESVNVKVGDVFASSWGYDQTNVNFYQVIETRGSMTVVIREIESRFVNENLTRVAPKKDHFRKNETPMTKRVQVYNSRVYLKIESYANAYRITETENFFVTSPYDQR